MNDASTSSVPAPYRPIWRRRSFWLVLLLSLAAFGGTGGWLWHRYRSPPPAPPTLDLDDVDPAVAVAINKRRQQVLDNPRSAPAWGKLGEVLTAFHYWKEGIVCFAQAEQLDPNEPRWPYHQGVLQLLLYNPNDAIPRLRRAVELCGNSNLAARLRLSEGLLSLGRLEEAEEGFRFLLERDPTNARVQLGLGRLALQRRQWQQAQSHLETAASDRHSAREAAIALAELHQRRGDGDAAEKWRGRAERLPPDTPWPDPFIEEILQLQAGKRFRLDEAEQLLQHGRVAEAITQLYELVKDYPDFTKAWFSLGRALLKAGDSPAAERVMGKVVELAPRYAEAHNDLGVARLRQGKWKEAAAAFNTAIDLKPDFALAYVNLGHSLLPQKDQKGALSAFRSAVHYRPNDPAVHIELAELLHQTHQETEALEQVRQALQLNPADAQAKQLLKKLREKRSSSPR
jgi:tetratricopeptide (TPR) repeat protein